MFDFPTMMIESAHLSLASHLCRNLKLNGSLRQLHDAFIGFDKSLRLVLSFF